MCCVCSAVPHAFIVRKATAFKPVEQGASVCVCWVSVFAQVHHPKTHIMASSLRTRDDALALSGCDFLLLPDKVGRVGAHVGRIGTVCLLAQKHAHANRGDMTHRRA